jgi:hypothetical protein
MYVAQPPAFGDLGAAARLCGKRVGALSTTQPHVRRRSLAVPSALADRPNGGATGEAAPAEAVPPVSSMKAERL